MKRLFVALPLIVALSACAADSSTTAPPAIRGGGPIVPDPATREAQSPNAGFDYGYVVWITPQGLRPATLLSGCCLPLKFENLMQQTVSIVFGYQAVNSGPIAPGGSWSWTPPHVESVVYHTGQGPPLTGNLQVQQTNE